MPWPNFCPCLSDFRERDKDGGILGIFHKTSQGQSYIDPLYGEHRSDAQDAGLLWGGYHFGDRSMVSSKLSTF